MARRMHNFLPNHRHKFAVIEGSRVKLLWPWMQWPFVEWNFDLDWGFNPVTIIYFVLPVFIIWGVAQLISTELRINKLPVCPWNVLGSKAWMSDYLDEILKAQQCFLQSPIPIRFSKQKWRLIWIWLVTVSWIASKSVRGRIHQVFADTKISVVSNLIFWHHHLLSIQVMVTHKNMWQVVICAFFWGMGNVTVMCMGIYGAVMTTVLILCFYLLQPSYLVNLNHPHGCRR